MVLPERQAAMPCNAKKKTYERTTSDDAYMQVFAAIHSLNDCVTPDCPSRACGTVA